MRIFNFAHMNQSDPGLEAPDERYQQTRTRFTHCLQIGLADGPHTWPDIGESHAG